MQGYTFRFFESTGLFLATVKHSLGTYENGDPNMVMFIALRED